MARYFFNVRHKPGPLGVAIDLDGDEITDDGQVREYALVVARDLIARTRLDSISNCSTARLRKPTRAANL